MGICPISSMALELQHWTIGYKSVIEHSVADSDSEVGVRVLAHRRNIISAVGVFGVAEWAFDGLLLQSHYLPDNDSLGNIDEVLHRCG